MESTLRKDALAVTFLEVELLIKHTVHHYRRLHGGDWEDLFSTALQAFMKAFETHGESKAGKKSSFTSYVRWVVWHDLMSEGRRIAYRGNLLKKVDNSVLQDQETRPCGWAFTEFLEDLSSEDARLLVKMIIDAPEELATIIRKRNLKPRGIKNLVRDFLLESGWTLSRFSEAFEEVKEIWNAAS